MQLTSVQTIKSLLKKYNIHPRKYLGQNFLISREVLGEIIEAAELSEKDTVLEIGPGIGVLTLELAKQVKKVIAIEKDLGMVEIVRDVINVLDVRNVEIVQGDILKIFNFPAYAKASAGGQFPISNYKVVANIPYYITSPVIRMFLEAGDARPHLPPPPLGRGRIEEGEGGNHKPELMILMTQKEVAQRICSKPPDMSVLSVSVQFYAEPKIISYVSKKCFWPRPKIDSAILKISRIKHEFSHEFSRIDTDLFFKIVKAGFSSKRKLLINNLSRVILDHRRNAAIPKEEIKNLLIQAKINPKSRAENLDVKDWVRIYEEINRY